MNEDLHLFLSAISIASFGVILYYYVTESSYVKKKLNSVRGEVRYILFQRLLGMLIFGIFPLLILIVSRSKSIADYGVTMPVNETFFWIAILSIVVITINYFNSRTPQNLELYPQIRKEIWTLKLLIISTASWIAYLLAYEFLFRGFLLFSTMSLLGLWPAIILNTAIYSLVHLPKGLKETIGAIPLGVLLCYLTAITGSIWIAVITHIVMAMSNEWLSIHAHPKIVLKIFLK